VQRTKLGLKPSSTLGIIVPGTFTPVLAEHTRHLILVDILSVGVVAHAKQVEAAKLVIYRAFVSGELDRPKSLARHVQDLY